MRLQGNVLAAARVRKKPEACTYIYMYVIYKYNAHIYEYVYVCIGNSMITLCDKSSNSYYDYYVYNYDDYYNYRCSININNYK